MKRLAAWMLALTMLAASMPAVAEEEEEFSIADFCDVIWEDEVELEDVTWDFPVALTDMDPMYVVLANKTMLLDKTFVPDPLVTMKARKTDKAGNNTNGGVRKASSSEMKLQGTCAEALTAMFEGAEQDGILLYLKSAYRSWQTQNTMYYNRLKKNKGKDDGWVSKPGASDHQTGLGCDIVSKAWRDKAMNGNFGKTEEAKWMAAHCHEYGFILRYPSDKEELTEINYEPWHFRYVGIPAATYIMKNGLCLEEFADQLNAAIAAYIANGGDESLVKPFMQVSAEY